MPIEPHSIFRNKAVFRVSFKLALLIYYFYLGREGVLKALLGSPGVYLRGVSERDHVRAVTFEEETPSRAMLPTLLGASLLRVADPVDRPINLELIKHVC